MLDRAGARGGFLQRFVSRGRTPATIAARLTYEDVVHRYGDLEAVSGVNLDVAPGEIVCLIGQSGCGKTTLLRLAAGVELPTAGRMFPHLSNLANVMFGLKALPRAAALREARLALERVGLGELADAYPHMLSGGEQQRVALARAVAPRPSVLLMDEPFSGLDRRLRDEVREDTLAVLREARVTCIIVTHDPEEALRMGDRIALMRAGRLVQVDEPETIYRKPTDIFAARYFCELNEVIGRVRGGKVETPIGLFPAPELPDGSEAIVAIRPQGIHLRPAGLCIPGMLEHRRFLGEVELLDIAVNGLDAPLKARVRQSLGVPVKSEIGLEIDPAEVLVFAGSGA